MADQNTLPSERLPADITAMQLPSSVRPLMAYEMHCIVCRIRAPLTLVSATPTNVTVPVLHVFIQTKLSQTLVVAMETGISGTGIWRQNEETFNDQTSNSWEGALKMNSSDMQCLDAVRACVSHN